MFEAKQVKSDLALRLLQRIDVLDSVQIENYPEILCLRIRVEPHFT